MKHLQPSSDAPDTFAILRDERLAQLHEAFLRSQLNDHTRQTYANGIDAFLRYADAAGLADILDVEPAHIVAFTRTMGEDYETTTVRLYLSAIRVFLDSCVVDGLISVNPSTSVRLPRLDARHGKTPVIVSTEVRRILDSIPDGERATTADLRDRALIGLMTYSFFRISAALRLDRKDYVMRGEQPWIIGMEKGSKRHEMPVHPELQDMLDALISKGSLHAPDTPLFQSASNRGGHLTGRRYNRRSAWAMVGRRARAAGIQTAVCNHTFRATGITTYLENGGTIEDARVMANHSSSTTTKLYDRTLDRAKADEVLKIRI